MALDSTSQLAGTIGGLINSNEETRQQINPSDSESQEQVALFEEIVVDGTITITKHVYASDSFILDHPTQCDLDSATLKLDGGYDQSFPLTFPITFTETGTVIDIQQF